MTEEQYRREVDEILHGKKEEPKPNRKPGKRDFTVTITVHEEVEEA